MSQATRTRRHLRRPKASRFRKIFGFILDAAGLAVYLWVLYSLVLIANEYISGI